jgi:ubiquitin carboxyl-terminal hydrolase 36/42
MADRSIDELLQAVPNLLPRRLAFQAAKFPDKAQDLTHLNLIPLNRPSSTTNGTTSQASKPKSTNDNNNNNNNNNKSNRNNTESPSTFGSALPPNVLPYPSALPYPRRHLHPEGDIERRLQWAQVTRIGCGLDNLGNTCFANAVLQCLTYTPPFANYLLTRQHSKTCSSSGHFCLLCILESHVALSLTSQRRSIAPTATIRNLRNIAKHFRIGRQEDSHEFLRYAIEAMQASCLRNATGCSKPDDAVKRLGKGEPQTTVVHRIFGGVLLSSVYCQHAACRYQSDTYEPFLDISLELKGATTLEAALRNFVQPEKLDKHNQYRCDRCKKLSQAVKRLSICRPPNVLNINLKRFNVFGQKIHKQLDFTETLNIAPFLTPGSPILELPRSACTYRLYAVLVHSGYSTNSGHYYAFVKNSAGIWYRMDDCSVSQVSVATVLKQHAYMLFYCRVAPSKSLLSTCTVAANATTANTAAIGTKRPRPSDHQQANSLATTAVGTTNHTASSPTPDTPETLATTNGDQPLEPAAKRAKVTLKQLLASSKLQKAKFTTTVQATTTNGNDMDNNTNNSSVSNTTSISSTTINNANTNGNGNNSATPASKPTKQPANIKQLLQSETDACTYAPLLDMLPIA